MFEEFPELPINIDCKEDNDTLMQKVIYILRDLDNREDVLIDLD